MAIDQPLRDRAAAVLQIYRQAKLRIATAESCTGGLVAACLTEIAGSSDVIERGFVTYSNDAKMELLAVDANLLTKHGAVSAHVARAMAEGALARSHADVALSVTGVAGPGGGTASKPVGLVYFACARKGHEIIVERLHFPGDRQAVRRASVETALDLLDQRLK